MKIIYIYFEQKNKMRLGISCVYSLSENGKNEIINKCNENLVILSFRK
jgi:hypothetical protein